LEDPNSIEPNGWIGPSTTTSLGPRSALVPASEVGEGVLFAATLVAGWFGASPNVSG
jgi:hypothetical protein